MASPPSHSLQKSGPIGDCKPIMHHVDGVEEKEEEAEEVEEVLMQPRFKYSRVLNDISKLFDTDAASCLIAEHEKFIAIGCKWRRASSGDQIYVEVFHGMTIDESARVLDETLQGYIDRASRRASDTNLAAEFNRKLKELKEALLDESAMTQMGRGNRERVAQISQDIRSLSTEEGSVSGEDFKEIAGILIGLADVTIAHLSELVDGGLRVDAKRFADCLSELASTEGQLINIGREQFSLMSRTPNLPEPEDEEEDEDQDEARPPKAKRARIKYERPTGEARQLAGTSAQAVQAEEDDSLQKELDRTMRHLRKACKNNPNGVDYYRFVIDPQSYGVTVENMFYVSFLVRDQKLSLKVDRESGLPMISRILKGQEKPLDKSIQAISTLSRPTWEKLIEQLNIKEPMFKQKSNAEE